MAAQSAQPAQEDVYTVTIRNRMSVTVKDSNGNLVEGVELDKLIAKMTGQRSAYISLIEYIDEHSRRQIETGK